MKTLISIMMVWISIQTGFIIPDEPLIVYKTPSEIRLYAYGCYQDPIPEGNDDICNSNTQVAGTPKALYDPDLGAILLPQGFKPNTILEESILLHELVHHLQYTNNYDKEVECGGKLEEQAYTLQDKWLFEKYHTNVWDVVGIGRLLYHILTNCQNYY